MIAFNTMVTFIDIFNYPCAQSLSTLSELTCNHYPHYQPHLYLRIIPIIWPRLYFWIIPVIWPHLYVPLVWWSSTPALPRGVHHLRVTVMYSHSSCHCLIVTTRLESTGISQGIWTLVYGLWTSSLFYGLMMTQGYQVDHSLPQRLYQRNVLNVLLEHVGLIRVFPLAVHLFFKCWAGIGGHTESHLLLGFYY